MSVLFFFTTVSVCFPLHHCVCLFSSSPLCLSIFPLHHCVCLFFLFTTVSVYFSSSPLCLSIFPLHHCVCLFFLFTIVSVCFSSSPLCLSVFLFATLPVCFLLLVLQLAVGLLQLVSQHLEVLSQFVLSLPFLGQEHQLPGRVVQRDVAQEQAFPRHIVQVQHAW